MPRKTQSSDDPGGPSVRPKLRLLETGGRPKRRRSKRTLEIEQAPGWRLIDCRPDLYECLAATSKSSLPKRALAGLKAGVADLWTMRRRRRNGQ